ncbi:glycosyltransferase family 4 protein [Flavobacterium fluviale]|uniref:glycosyltransferase family 4 protein n=1 Tax=Flavobacterium fluviale TaxID=2249356 RepID=UPI0013B448C9|nr:glycosyltransferase [Flavobacterium fluviale]
MDSFKEKILLFGPIADYGGREIECGLIALVLSSKYEVSICSTGTITNKSQLFNFNKNQRVFSIKELLFNRFFILKIAGFLSYFKNTCKGEVSNYVKNYFAKKFFQYDEKVEIVLKDLISDFDAVFIIAQLSSGLVSEIIQLAKKDNKKVLFRTTGTITFSDYDYIELVDCFIHHSYNNASRINKSKKFAVIDQCANNESDLLNIPLSQRQVCNFLILSRLSQEKGVEEIIDSFLKVSSERDILFIAGNGILEIYLKTKYKNSRNVKFLGFLSGSKLSDLIKSVDCLIIPSPEESGPLVGIESMCAGKIVISTRVGAMEERLQGTSNDYWFDYNDFKSFEKVFFEVKDLKELEVKNISIELRRKYIEEYSIDIISNKYLKIVEETLGICV